MGSLIDIYVNRFVVGASGCHTVNCVLVRLSSAFLAIKDFVEDFPLGSLSEIDLVYESLNHPKVMRILAGLADHVDVVETKIQGDVRFKNLRPYLSLIIDAIRYASQKCTPLREYYDRERPPLWRIEYEEHRARSIEPSTSYRVVHGESYREADIGHGVVYRVSVRYEDSAPRRRPQGRVRVVATVVV